MRARPSFTARVETLPAGVRDCLLLREQERLSVAEIAERIGARQDQVREWLYELADTYWPRRPRTSAGILRHRAYPPHTLTH